jgi:virginiamycin A acetyltransferase
MSEAMEGVVQVLPPTRGPLAMAVKRALQFVFLLLCLPWFIAYGISTVIWGRDRAFLLTMEYLAALPGMMGVYLRQAFLQRTLAKCGSDSYFGWLSTFSMPQASVGDNVCIGRGCRIGFAAIGSHVLLADGSQILSGGREHGLPEDGKPPQDQLQTFRRVTVGNGVWVGANAVIMADVGDFAIIGAGAVVNKPVPPRTVAVGIPARVVKELS